MKARYWPCVAVNRGDGWLQLQALLSGGQGAVRKIKRAQILLAADAHSTDD